MKHLHKHILGMVLTCTMLTTMAFVTLPKQPSSILVALNLASTKSELRTLYSFRKEPEKKTSDNAIPKSTLRGRVKTTSHAIIELTAVATEQMVQLKWISPKGHHTRKFIIQRSRDADKYDDIAELKPTHNQEFNSFLDETPMGGFINYYRLLEFDSERNLYVYSPMEVEVSAVNGEAFGVTLHTSEVGEMIRIKMENIKENDILLNTPSGMGVPCDAVQKSKIEVILLPTYALSAGEYIVKIRDGKDERRFKVQLKKSDKMF